MGGNQDKTGSVDYQKLKKVICEDFGLTIPIDVGRDLPSHAPIQNNFYISDL